MLLEFTTGASAKALARLVARSTTLPLILRQSGGSSLCGILPQSGNLLSKRLDFQLMEGLDRWHLLAIR